MMRSSPPPEPVLGKRVHADDQLEASDGEHDEESSTDRPQPLSAPITNLTAATLRYAAKKKLRPEQRDDVEAFVLASALWATRMNLSDPLSTGYCAWPPGQIICLLDVPRKQSGRFSIGDPTLPAVRGTESM